MRVLNPDLSPWVRIVEFWGAEQPRILATKIRREVQNEGSGGSLLCIRDLQVLRPLGECTDCEVE